MFPRLLFPADLPTWALLLDLALEAVIVIQSGARLTRLADRLAEEYRLGRARVGMLLLANVPSPPPVRMGQIDLAIGNIFSIKMFDAFVLPVCKVASLICGHPLRMAGLAFHPDPNLLAGLLPIVLTVLAIGGLTAGPRGRILGVGLDSMAIAFFYLAGMTLLPAGA